MMPAASPVTATLACKPPAKAPSKQLAKTHFRACDHTIKQLPITLRVNPETPMNEVSRICRNNASECLKIKQKNRVIYS
jgi:hypothetical protein